MKRIKIPLFFICISLAGSSFAQKHKPDVTGNKVLSPPPPALTKTVCDCKDAIKINIQKNTKYGLTVPPDGFGTIQEITETSKYDKYAFEKEHNTAWYLLTINFDGDFVFQIVPKDSTNDYDFLLYKYPDSALCDNILKHKVKPVRSNLSRVKPELKGVTGLSLSAKNEFIGKGLGESNSKYIAVKKGEKYILVLDNVYPDGKGHTIFFNYVKEVEISGVVLNDDSAGVKAEVSLIDNTGKTVKQIQTDKYGKYGFKTDLKENVNYNLSYTSDSGFTQIQTINTSQLNEKHSLKDIRTILPKLKKGSKYKMGSINFYGNESRLLPESMVSVESLYKLMKKNKKMVINIEGHVNGVGGGGDDKFNQTLSEDRAKTVYDYLLKNGIEKERMTTIGYGAKYMLYPRAAMEWEMSANRRVEINVITIE